MKLSGNWTAIGVLRDVDLFMNLVIDEATKTDERCPIGMVVTGGNSVLTFEAREKLD